jgi:MFS family permease
LRAAVAPVRAGRWLFDLPDFRRLWLIGLIVFAVRWLEMLVVGVFVYQRTGSAFQVAMMTLLRMAPMVMFGPLIGAYVERIERRFAQVLVGAGTALDRNRRRALAYAGRLEVWHLAVASFCNGIAWAADNPVRRVMIGEVVGPERMGAAMAIDVGANNASRMLGPTIGGLVLVGSASPARFRSASPAMRWRSSRRCACSTAIRSRRRHRARCSRMSIEGCCWRGATGGWSRSSPSRSSTMCSAGHSPA